MYTGKLTSWYLRNYLWNWTINSHCKYWNLVN